MVIYGFFHSKKILLLLIVKSLRTHHLSNCDHTQMNSDWLFLTFSTAIVHHQGPWYIAQQARSNWRCDLDASSRNRISLHATTLLPTSANTALVNWQQSFLATKLNFTRIRWNSNHDANGCEGHCQMNSNNNIPSIPQNYQKNIRQSVDLYEFMDGAVGLWLTI